jgi:hypothetical protein
MPARRRCLDSTSAVLRCVAEGLTGWTAEVSVVGSDLGDPLGCIRISGDQIDRLALDLKADVNVAVGATRQTQVGGDRG